MFYIKVITLVSKNRILYFVFITLLQRFEVFYSMNIYGLEFCFLEIVSWNDKEKFF